jgi:hypothetical protein
MTGSHPRTRAKTSPMSLSINFPPEVRRAFGALAAAVRLSDHFDGSLRSIVEDWAVNQSTSVFDVVASFPAIAAETFKHVRATGDDLAEKAWGEISSGLLEHGFELQPTPRLRDR